MIPRQSRTEQDQMPGVYRIPILHCSEREFFDAFRADLIQSAEHVIILPPFLSQNRAIQYYPVLRSLTVRQVAIDVYARPGQEQPETLRQLYGTVERGLKRAGARFHVRPGMHEKAGMIDSRILWHGSLNILSHNDTRESMLRFESPELVQEVSADLGLGPFPYPFDRGEPAYAMVAEGTGSVYRVPPEEAPSCPRCSQSMLRFENIGMWICQGSPRCSGTLPLEVPWANPQSAEDRKTGQRLGLSCPICGSPLEIRQEAFLRVACPDPQCGFALDPRLSVGIVRVLSQRDTR